MKIKVGIDGHYRTITEALNAVPFHEPAEIFISAGIYNEKIVCDKHNITIIGEGIDKTVITFGDGAKMMNKDGTLNGTFRTATMFFSGDTLKLKNLSVINTAGQSKIVGQALAVYNDVTSSVFENVRMSSYQDTLFCSPLPLAERISGGFKGPREYAPRKHTTSTYTNCIIEGDIDFIFGGGDAYFNDCDIVSLGKGYVAAPSTGKDCVGFVFRNCNFISQCEDNSVYLARPWREFGKVHLIECFVDKHIKPEGFDHWGKEENKQTATFIEERSRYADGYVLNRVDWVNVIT